MRVVLTKEECYGSIIDLYDTVLRKTGREPADDDRYDPSKIYCSLNVMEEIEQHTKDTYPKKYTKEGFLMHWCNIGPKASEEYNDPDPEKYIVEVEEGWVSKEEEN